MNLALTGLRRFREAGPVARVRALREKAYRFAGFLRFAFFPSIAGPVFTAYRPESDFVHEKHPEFKGLVRNWSAGNRAGNAGDLARLYSLMLNVKQVVSDHVPGDFAELGVYRGTSAGALAHFARGNDRQLFLFDTFEGFDHRDLRGIDEVVPMEFSDNSVAAVARRVGSDPRIRFVPGYFPNSVTEEHRSATFAFVHLDCDLYEPMKAGLDFFYPRLAPGGCLLIHDYGSGAWPGVTLAVDQFCETIPERPVLLPDRSGSAVIRRNGTIVS